MGRESYHFYCHCAQIIIFTQYGGVKNIKVGNVDFFEKIPNGVTLQIMEHISKLSFVKYPCAKLSKRKLQKAEIGSCLFSHLFWTISNIFQFDS